MKNLAVVLAKISMPALDQNAACAHIDVLSAAKLLRSRDPGDRTEILYSILCDTVYSGVLEYAHSADIQTSVLIR